MKLNNHCLRAVLLEADRCDKKHPLTAAELQTDLPAFCKEDVWYSVQKLQEGGLIYASCKKHTPRKMVVTGLTDYGQRVLYVIGPKDRWPLFAYAGLLTVVDWWCKGRFPRMR